MKRCYKCKENKPLSDFFKDKSKKDGHWNKCKSCYKKDSTNTDYRRRILHKVTQVDIDKRTGNCSVCGQDAKVYKNVQDGKEYYLCDGKRNATDKARVSHENYNEEYFKNYRVNRADGKHGLSPGARAVFLRGKYCQICGTTENLVVDHCHETLVLRDPLCNNCNTAIGLLGEDLERLKSAIQYLEKHKGLTFLAGGGTKI